MSKFGLVKNIVLIGALVAVVCLIVNYSEPFREQISQIFHLSGANVKGASTQRAQEISGKIESDLSGQLSILEDQVLNFTIGDAITGLTRLQKIPQDFYLIQQYSSNKIDNFLKKK